MNIPVSEFKGFSGLTGEILTVSVSSSTGGLGSTNSSVLPDRSPEPWLLPVPASRTSEDQMPIDASDMGKLSTQKGITGALIDKILLF